VCYIEHNVNGTAQQVDKWYCRLNGVSYSEHNVEGIAQQVDSNIAG